MGKTSISVQLAPGTLEQAFSVWEEVPLAELAATVFELAQLRHLRAGAYGPAIIAINGRSGAGKSTLALALAEVAKTRGSEAVILEADDLMWWEPMWQWAHIAIDGVFEALRRGQGVKLTPPQWKARGREGAIIIPDSTDLLIFEGVGSSQTPFSEYLDAAVWVQSDHEVARRLGLERDIRDATNGNAEESAEFWDRWDESERAFLEEDLPWFRADYLVLGNAEPMPEVGMIRVVDPATRTV